MLDLTQGQLAVIEAPTNARFFLSGPAGCGKTTAGVERMLYLLAQGIPADALLVLTPQRTLAAPYADALSGSTYPPGTMSLARGRPFAYAGGQVSVLTVGGLARRMVDLFWPLASEAAGFAHPDRPPVFLTLETAQYYMARLVRPLLDQGYFESVTIDRNRLYSQILDNLNKSAAVGFPHVEIGERLEAAWIGDPAQRRVYADAQECANRFRDYCLEYNLLDFSLQLEIFWGHLWPHPAVRDYLTHIYHHLIFDNLEEDMPRAHDLIREWLPIFDSALLIYDQGGGYRRFLGADPESAWALRELCDGSPKYGYHDVQAALDESFVVSEGIEQLSDSLEGVIAPDLTPHPPLPLALPALEARPGSEVEGLGEGAQGVRYLEFSDSRFYPQMLDWVSDEITRLVSEEQLPPSEIVVLAPYLSDALRFSLMNRMEARRIPVRSHRPSRSLRDEPAAQALLTLAALAHPGWEVRPGKFDVAYAFMLAIEEMDLVRAQLLAEIVYRLRDFSLSPFDQIKPEVQERITFVLGARYSSLRDWLLAYREGEPVQLDHFLRKLFGEVLSQPGFGFHRNMDAARVAASLIESVQKFRWAMEPTFVEAAAREAPPVGTPPGDGHGSPSDIFELGREYIAMLQDGVIAAQYLEAWRAEAGEAVLVAPAHTFLMMNRPATVQFWLDPGSGGWAERLFQPLTHPYVLSRHWEHGRLWTDADEVGANQQTLARLVTGLLRRCRERVYLGLSDLGESGFEQRGVLLKAFQKALQGTGQQDTD
jgi:hypothetical protein